MKFTEVQQANLTKVQDIELRILMELDRICSKYDLKYSLSGGTLLGAIRHKDFIPWDDDIDIDLRRNDFNKLLSVLPDELGDEFEFVNYNDFGNYFCDFIPRIFYRNSKTVNSFSVDGGKTNFANDDRMNRIFIELYCLHDTDSKTVKKQIFKVKMIYGLAMGHRFVPSSSKNYTAIQKAEVAILSPIGKHIPLNKIFSMYEKCVNRTPTDSGNLYFKPSVPLPVQEKNVFDKKLFCNYEYVKIRNNKAKAPCEYIKILESLYSNWKELPPEKDRHPGHFNLDNIEVW